MTLQQNHSFLVKRYNVVLRVSILPNNDIRIEPHNCTPENKRLWTIVARTYLTLAQTAVETNKGADAYALLFSVFESKGWDIVNIIEEH
jgi:hypothetical protein